MEAISPFLVYFTNAFCIANLLLLAIIVPAAAKKSHAAYYLAAVVALPAFPFVGNVIAYGAPGEQMPYFLIYVTSCLNYLWAPALEGYVRHLTGIDIFKKYRWYAHLIPFLGSFTFYLYITFDYEARVAHFAGLKVAQTSFYNDLINICMLLQIFLYVFLIYKSLHSEKTKAEVPALKLKWISKFIILILTLSVLSLVAYTFINQFIVDLLIMPVLCLMIYGALVFITFNYDVTDKEASKKITLSDEIPPLHLKYHSLNKTLLNENISRLEEYLATHKPHLQPEVSLQSISEATSIPTNYVSAIMNEHFGKSFFDLINSMRVQDVKILLDSDKVKNYSLEALGNECGFSSKSAFYKAFKKFEGITPGDYVSRHKTKNSSTGVI